MDDLAEIRALVAELRRKSAGLPPDSEEHRVTDAELVDALLVQADREKDPDAVRDSLAEAGARLDGLLVRARPGGRMHRALCLLTARAAVLHLEATGGLPWLSHAIGGLEQALAPDRGGPGSAPQDGPWWWGDDDAAFARYLLAVLLWDRRCEASTGDAQREQDQDRLIALLDPVVERRGGVPVPEIETLRALLGLARSGRSRCADHGNPARLADRHAAIVLLQAAYDAPEPDPDYRDAVAFDLALLRYLDDDHRYRDLLALLEPLTYPADGGARAVQALELGGDIATGLHDNAPADDTLALALEWHRRRTVHPDAGQEDRARNRLFLAMYLVERAGLPDAQRGAGYPPPPADRAEAVAQLELGLADLVRSPPEEVAELRTELLSCELLTLQLDLPDDLDEAGLDLLIERSRQYLAEVDPDDEDRPLRTIVAGLGHFCRVVRVVQPHLYTMIGHLLAGGGPAGSAQASYR